MTEQEYNIEVLCTCYSLERLKLQQKKLSEGTISIGSDVIDDAAFEELSKAILCYDEEKYKLIRDEMQRNRKKYRII